MTDRLNVVDLPGAAPIDIPRMLRLLADNLESGEESLEDAILIGVDSEQKLRMWFWGMHRRGGYHTIGMLEAAKFQLADQARMAP